MNNYIIIRLLLIFLLTSCNAQKNNLKDPTANILNAIVSDFNEPICLEANTFFESSKVKPNYLINHYFRVYNSSKESVAHAIFSYKNLDGLITKNELKKLISENIKWQKKDWNESDLKNQKNLILIKSETKSNCLSKKLLKISEPVFTSDKNKAMVLIKTTKNGTGSTFMKILKKENETWTIQGSIPIGTRG